MSATKARTLTLATRSSTLARWQAQSVQETLTARWPGLSFEIQVITTPGGRTLDQPLAEDLLDRGGQQVLGLVG